MIEQYLAELKAALAGADPALVQDALYDAEEHLRAEMSEAGTDAEARWTGIVEAYGSPDEVAQAYRETEVTVARALKAPAPVRPKGALGRFFGVVIDPSAWGALFYLVFALVTGTFYCVFVSVMLPLSIGLIPVLVGVPLLLAFFASVRAISLAEGRLVEALLGVRMPRRPRAMLQQGDWTARVKHWFTDGRTWTTILYMLLQQVLGAVYFSIVMIGLGLSTTLIALPIIQMFEPDPLIQIGGYGYLLQPWATPLVIAAGFLGCILTLHLVRLIGKGHAAYAKAMLVGRYSDAPDQAIAA
ncbi:MAG: sensor domain-containing protein [Actinomycetota bacterium]|nr:MAG: hypothetical protein FD171_172 [Actinomycetota bacterium]MDO8950576.1 sensor domain-containing protein [Actinomycetota bacterium]MDP3629565.1 sensor domain-containing protein [Actinomycetota bacterium]